jgi:hypothetical protein
MTKDKRTGRDRRKTFRTPKFPLNDSEGRIVLRDRRVCPERRIQGIVVDWKFDRSNQELKKAG